MLARRALTLALIFAAFTVAAVPAQAASRADRPATRSYVARVIVERALMADVTKQDRKTLWTGSECFGDREFTVLPRAQRRRICYTAVFGYMGDTGRNSSYPTFEPDAHIRRDQMASVVWRLATFGEDLAPDGNGVFIDVNRSSVHEPAIRWAALHGIIRGFDTEPATFRPAQPLTRRQARVLVDRVVAHWRNDAVR